MPDPVSEVALPRFLVSGHTRITQLTPLVSTDRYRHDYIAPVRPTPVPEGWANVANAIGNFARQVAVQRRLDEFVRDVGTRIGNRPLGYLVRVNIGADLYGNELPDFANLFTSIGLGVDPTDALAEAYGSDFLQAPRPMGGRQFSYYCWFAKVGPEMETSTCSHILSANVETRAREERIRRDLLGQVYRTTGPNPIEQIQAAEFWRDYANTRQQAVSDELFWSRMAALEGQMEAAQAAFNQAYGNYQIAAQEMAENAAELEMLGKISAVAGLIGSGAAVADSVAQWRRGRQQELTAQVRSNEQQVRTYRQVIIDRERMIMEEWTMRGQQIPSTRPDIPCPNGVC